MDKYDLAKNLALEETGLNLDMIVELLGSNNTLTLADEMMLSDAKGIVVRISENYEKNFGFEHNSIVGKSVYDLEAIGVFSPCVTAMVLRQKEKIVTTQAINGSENVMTTGIPIFNKDGELSYAICFNTITMEQVNHIQKKNRELQASIKQYTEEIHALRAKNTATGDLFFKSPKMQKIWLLLSSIANTKANVLITGETGVGKSVIAKALHNMSSRATDPFIEVNCAVLHENLIESELFGYEKGAFTGASSSGKIGKIELANHGTLFLDEIGELPLQVQSKLLQLIQEKTIERISSTKKLALDFRLIVATNKELEAEVAAGKFRKDLFYRLDVLRVHIPPLRERQEDIYPLAYHFLARYNHEYGKNLRMAPGLLNFLEAYFWPGNVRQLENLMERLAITCAGPTISLSDLPQNILYDKRNGFAEGQNTFAVQPQPATAASLPEGAQATTLPELMERYERQLILDAYQIYHSGAGVARHFGIDQSTASRKLAKYL